ncbi:hypothetical protein CYMTET_30907, partial [Cymbomonas tetramitiformis]
MINVGVWLKLNNRGLGYGDVGLSYEKILAGEYWRILTATFSHISFLHLIFNVHSAWSVGVAENMHGSGLGEAAFVNYTILLVVLPQLLVMGIYHILIHRFGREEYRSVTAVGYSCVVFGWMTILSQRQPSMQLSLVGLHLPMNLAPFGSLIFTSMIVPQASFIGHLAGILVGYLISWHMFSWMDIATTVNMLIWIGIGTIISLKQSGVFLPWLQFHGRSVLCWKSSQLPHTGQAGSQLPHTGQVGSQLPRTGQVGSQLPHTGQV